MNSAECGYAAALFDTMGTVIIWSQNRRYPDSLRVIITANNQIAACEFLKQRWGGTIFPHASSGAPRWENGSTHAELFIREALPFLRVENRRLQCEIALEWFTTIQPHGGRHHAGPRVAVPPEEQDRRRELQRRLRSTYGPRAGGKRPRA